MTEDEKRKAWYLRQRLIAESVVRTGDFDSEAINKRVLELLEQGKEKEKNAVVNAVLEVIK